MKIVVTGPKAAGKTTVGALLGKRLGIDSIDVDGVIEKLYADQYGSEKTFREIYQSHGAQTFRELERRAIAEVATAEWCVISTGGSSLMAPKSRRLLRPRSVWVYLDAAPDSLWDRLTSDGLPAFLQGLDDPRVAFVERTEEAREVLLPHCDCVVDIEDKDPDEVAEAALQEITAELASRMEAPNTFGDVIRLTTFGESHGPMVGAVLDGLPPDVEIDAEYIQQELDRRRPGQSDVSTSRTEADRVQIVSGVFEGKTTGTPIGLLINNRDTHSRDYEAIRELFRPGHADFTFWRKYGRRDHRGGGRSSGRETASRVAGGAIAKQILKDRGVTIRAGTVQIGEVQAQKTVWEEVENNPVRSVDPDAAPQMEECIRQARADGDSVGGVVKAEVTGVPAGLGDPVFAKLDARLAQAIFSIGAVRGVEFGAGFEAASLRGSQNNDEMRDMQFLTNNAGGILGGISSGQPIVIRVGIKPTPSVSVAQRTCDTDGNNRIIETEGRHDPCIAPRIVPVIESMIALVLLDAWEIQERINPGWNENE
ncbi:MAG: chorismate synthase [Armatimonadota bacterium]